MPLHPLTRASPHTTPIRKAESRTKSTITPSYSSSVAATTSKTSRVRRRHNTGMDALAKAVTPKIHGVGLRKVWAISTSPHQSSSRITPPIHTKPTSTPTTCSTAIAAANTRDPSMCSAGIANTSSAAVATIVAAPCSPVSPDIATRRAVSPTEDQ